MKIQYKRKRFNIEVKRAGFFRKYTGLMIRSRNTRNILFDFSENRGRAIHSYFVFFPFLALWLDKNDRVVDWVIVRPFTSYVESRKRCNKLIEIPMNMQNEHIFRIFVEEKKDLNIT